MFLRDPLHYHRPAFGYDLCEREGNGTTGTTSGMFAYLLSFRRGRI